MLRVQIAQTLQIHCVEVKKQSRYMLWSADYFELKVIYIGKLYIQVNKYGVGTRTLGLFGTFAGYCVASPSKESEHTA